jgi:hypothetical protein
MSITKAISTAWQKKRERGHQFIYWCVDVHGVIVTPTYKLNNDGAFFYEVGVEGLQMISSDPTNKIILWSSSYDEPFKAIVKQLSFRNVRVDYVNENPECPSTELCDFSKKFYMDIILDDKAGFEPNEDWELIYQFLKNKKDYE